MSSSLTSSDFAAEDFAEEDELELFATEEALKNIEESPNGFQINPRNDDVKETESLRLDGDNTFEAALTSVQPLLSPQNYVCPCTRLCFC